MGDSFRGNRRFSSLRRIHWGFTAFNISSEDVHELRDLLENSAHFKLYCFQVEVTKTGLPHFQGYFSLNSPANPLSRKLGLCFLGIQFHFYLVRNTFAAVEYCSDKNKRLISQGFPDSCFTNIERILRRNISDRGSAVPVEQIPGWLFPVQDRVSRRFLDGAYIAHNPVFVFCLVNPDISDELLSDFISYLVRTQRGLITCQKDSLNRAKDLVYDMYRREGYVGAIVIYESDVYYAYGNHTPTLSKVQSQKIWELTRGFVHTPSGELLPAKKVPVTFIGRSFLNLPPEKAEQFRLTSQ